MADCNSFAEMFDGIQADRGFNIRNVEEVKVLKQSL
jgi:hypothetical protein